MLNQKIRLLDPKEYPAVSENKLKKVTGGAFRPERGEDGLYHAQCEYCGAWFHGKTYDECMQKLSRHGRGECYWNVL